MSDGINSNKIAFKYPWIFIIISLIVILNNYYKFSPAQVLTGNQAIIIPLVLFILGIFGYYNKKKS